jgi:predicted transcriptional regulator
MVRYLKVLPFDKGRNMAISVKLDETLKGRVQHLAAARQRSSHWIMREAIARYVEQEEARDSIRQAAIDAWEGYQATGLHVTFEEADTWLAELENGTAAEPPACHP